MDEYLLQYPVIKLGWEDYRRLIDALAKIKYNGITIYNHQDYTLYLTDKDNILKSLDNLNIDYIVISPSNTEMYLRDAI